MTKIAIIDQDIIDEIRNNQLLILKKIGDKNASDDDKKFISKQTAAQMFDCSDQTIASFEKEGIIKRHGRGKFIRYSVDELKHALKIKH